MHRNSARKNARSCYDVDDVFVAFAGLVISDSSSCDYTPQGRRSWSPDRQPYNVARKEAPTKPGVYKIYREGEYLPEYIGEANNIRGRLYNHKYGDQHIDEHLRKKGDYCEVETKVLSSKSAAKKREKAELADFEATYGRLPKYNHKR